MDEDLKLKVKALAVGLFSDGHSTVFGDILDEIGIKDDEMVDRTINAFQELIEGALGEEITF